MTDIDTTVLEQARAGNVTAKGKIFVALGRDQAALDKLLAEKPGDEGKPVETKNNPFKRGSPSFNLTEQGRIFRTDPALAARLARAAGSKIA